MSGSLGKQTSASASRMSALHHWRIFRVAFVMSALAVSALFPTFSTAASISSVVLLRRLRQRRAKALVEMAIRFRGGFGRDGVTMAVSVDQEQAIKPV
jgi:hypothetical protein